MFRYGSNAFAWMYLYNQFAEYQIIILLLQTQSLIYRFYSELNRIGNISMGKGLSLLIPDFQFVTTHTINHLQIIWN